MSLIHLQSANYGAEEGWKEMFSFLVETMETAVKAWHETSKVDTRVYFLLDKEKTQTDKFAPAVNIDKVLKKGMRERKKATRALLVCLLTLSVP